MFCFKCGTPLADGARFCSYCGAAQPPKSESGYPVSGFTPNSDNPQPSDNSQNFENPQNSEYSQNFENPQNSEYSQNFENPQSSDSFRTYDSSQAYNNQSDYQSGFQSADMNNSYQNNPYNYATAPNNGNQNGSFFSNLFHNQSTLQTILTILCFVGIVFFAYGTITNFFRTFTYLFSIFNYAALGNLCWMFCSLMRVFAGLIIIFTLLTFALLRKTENIISLYTAVLAGCIGYFLLSFVASIFTGLAYLAWGGFMYFPWTLVLKNLAYAVVTAGIVTGLMIADGYHPFTRAASNDFSVIISRTVEDFKSAWVQFSNTQNENKKAAAAAATYSNVAPNNGGVVLPASSYVDPSVASAMPRHIKTDRGLLIYILLGLVTCGIYTYVYIHELSKDMNTMCAGDGRTTAGVWKFILLTIVTCGIYAIVWWCGVADRLAANAPRYGLSFPETGTTFLLWYLVGAFVCGIGPFVAIHNVFKNANLLAQQYNMANNV